MCSGHPASCVGAPSLESDSRLPVQARPSEVLVLHPWARTQLLVPQFPRLSEDISNGAKRVGGCEALGTSRLTWGHGLIAPIMHQLLSCLVAQFGGGCWKLGP